MIKITVGVTRPATMSERAHTLLVSPALGSARPASGSVMPLPPRPPGPASAREPAAMPPNERLHSLPEHVRPGSDPLPQALMTRAHTSATELTLCIDTCTE